MKNIIPPILLASDALRISMGHACLHDLPWLKLSNRNEEADFSAFEARTGSAVKKLVRQERLDMVPRGHVPEVWAIREKRYGAWWRPHRLDEVFVEAFFPWWKEAVE